MTTKIPNASPSMRLHARENNIDLDELSRQTNREFMHSADLDQSNASRMNYPTQESLGAGVIEPLSKVAQLTATNLNQSQLIPAVTHQDAVDTTALEKLRQQIRDTNSLKVSALAFQVMALSKCLRTFPRFNASLTDNGESLWLKENINIGIAVDTPHGLMVPVIKDADQLGLSDITDGIAQLAEKARARKLKPDQMQGAGMSISNLGVLGGRAFTPMINPPELAIMGVMKTKMEPVWNGDEFMPLPMCPLSLTYDHRAINGADAQRFLNHFISLLADPRQLMF